MSTVVISGAQWGDEGKGKIVDYLAAQADTVVRFQGGSNAGHTVSVGGEEYKLRLLPSGILYKGTTCIIGNGVVVDPQCLLEEIDNMQKRGVDTSGIRVSNRAHVFSTNLEKIFAATKKSARPNAESVRATSTRRTESEFAFVI